MIVKRTDLERSLETLRARVLQPRAGIHGPGSHAWRLKRESINFVGGGRAALLQLAHPYVAHAIDQHSKTRADIQGRFHRTFVNVFAMTFGELDRAVESARRVHTVHERINGRITEDVGRFRRGDPYHANDSAALLWVWATLIDTIICCHERFVRTVPAPELERFYLESQNFALLFGIPEQELPADYAAFRAYVDGMFESTTLEVGTPALDMSRFLLVAPRKAVAPVMAWYRVMTAGLLPPRLRDQFQLRWTIADRAVFAVSSGALRQGYQLVPRSVRYLPAYVEAQRRLRGKGPSPVGAAVERLTMAGLGGR